MKITTNQLRRIIREEKEKVLDEIDLDNPDGSNGDHHWPRISQAEAKDLWREQIDAASYDLENDITVEIRKVVLAAMKSVSGKLVNGDYA